MNLSHLIEACEPRRLFAAQYTVLDLGTLGGTSAAANSINNAGVIVGVSATPGGANHAFRYQTGATNGVPGNPRMRDLGTLGGNESAASEINNSGNIIGSAQRADGSTHAFLLVGDGISDLGVLNNGVNSYGHAISDGNALGGQSEASSHGGPTVHAAIFRTGQNPSELLDSRDVNTSAVNSINRNGQIVGEVQTDTGAIHAAVFTGFFRYADLGTLGGNFSTATDNSDSNFVVGYSAVSGGSNHAFFWNGQQLKDLGTLGGGSSRALAINNFNQIVGTSDGAAFFYNNNQMRNLNNLIAPGSGWVLKEARDINDKGQIVGVGVRNGQERAFLLNPIARAPADTVRPTAKLNFSVVNFGGITHSFRVSYSDNVAINVRTLDHSDIVVTGPGGYRQTARIVIPRPQFNGPTRHPTYQIFARGGFWDFTDNGTYFVSVVQGQVRDTTGNAVLPGAIGSFKVNIARPGGVSKKALASLSATKPVTLDETPARLERQADALAWR